MGFLARLLGFGKKKKVVQDLSAPLASPSAAPTATYVPAAPAATVSGPVASPVSGPSASVSSLVSVSAASVRNFWKAFSMAGNTMSPQWTPTDLSTRIPMPILRPIETMIFGSTNQGSCDLIQRLGSGSFGSVFSAVLRLPGMSQVVAVKKFIADNDQSLLSFINEMSAMDKIGKNDSLVNFLGGMRTPDSFLLFLQLYEGGSLEGYVREFGTITFGSALAWAG